ncbi:hypothetical protein K2173_008460 [Erythroxylum novogranatense]|uniref:Tower domain-containing protein n=1 Tax=Erythroxylum novogranatense TaxID=1862640 RepID=A0AAV8UA87_9ROSI|nr:hypothetical protein K2173_008460 [Erythroxylum novogranatense]
MSTWQIVSDAGNEFRWEASGRIIPAKEQIRAQEIYSLKSNHRLPSMTDLLLEGCSNLLENEDGNGGGGDVPIFRTGLGKSVVLKQSSLVKAMSILCEDDEVIQSGEMQRMRDSSSSLFHTASGKMFNVSSAGLARAKKLLGLEEDSNESKFQGFQQPIKLSGVNEQTELQKLSSSNMKDVREDNRTSSHDTFVPRLGTDDVLGSKSMEEVNPKRLQTEMGSPGPRTPFKFHTAGGRSLSVSSDALERARSLLGDPDGGNFFKQGDIFGSTISVLNGSRSVDALANTERDIGTASTYPVASKNKYISKTFISPLRSSSNQVWKSIKSENVISGTSLIKSFNSVNNYRGSTINTPHNIVDSANANDIDPGPNSLVRSSSGCLVDISNTTDGRYTNNAQNNEKKRCGRGSAVSLFKRPRSSKFTTPLHKNVLHVSTGLSTSSSENVGCRRVISTKYPCHFPRMHIKEYFGVPLSAKFEHLIYGTSLIRSETADKFLFYNEPGQDGIGVEAFHHMLVLCGASIQYASKRWVVNHYRWIVWKLGCYDRFYPRKSAAKFLTVSNVFEELKYRYEREVNHGHRSAIKRILEGDAPPSSMLVLYIAAIHIISAPKVEADTVESDVATITNVAKVELSDGWYSVDALLDVPLSKLLASGKLFVGQKLRIWGAALCGWVGPVSPLEVSGTVSFSLHINGTYRAHWADKLGFCKGVGVPLAFSCIKSNGGPVPRTLVGITRIYPILYKEKLNNGGSVVRSERMEAKIMQSYNQRRSGLIEGVISDLQRGTKGPQVYNESDSEDGAKILKLLETAAEPEVLMAEMSPEQLASVASYQAKLEASRQLEMDKAIEKALQGANLGKREVTPFMRIRVVGLREDRNKAIGKAGLITIWNPTEKQQVELIEGQAYAVSGLLPVNSNTNTLYLQARGSTTKWLPLSPLTTQHFQPFFNPRMSVSLSNLGEVPLCSEFDIVACVVYVGEVYMTAQQKKQWVFVTDSSITLLESEEIANSLLAISFCLQCTDDDASPPINHNMMGSTVGFFNLVKSAKDQNNHLWLAEATENSTYSLNFDSSNCSHLRSNAVTTQSWAKSSKSLIDGLKEKLKIIIGDCEG